VNIVNPFHFIKFTREARADLQAWQSFIETSNGKSVFLADTWVTSDHLKLFTNVSGSLGYAAVFGSLWFAKAWPSHRQHYQIAVKQLFPIVLALDIWEDIRKNSKLLFLCDNQAVVEVINKESCKDKLIMKLIRRLVLVALKLNVVLELSISLGNIMLLLTSYLVFNFRKPGQ